MTFLAILSALTVPMSQEAGPFTQMQGVAEPSRLALTPKIDGSIQADEWDSFAKAGDTETYLQWEPGKLYVAGKVAADRDLVISIDNKQNGWLVGKDNIEYRLRWADSKITVQSRQLDATQVSGPVWIEQPALAKAVIAKGSVLEGMLNIEAVFSDPGLNLVSFNENEKLNVRIDSVAQTAQSLEAFYPRVGTQIRLSTERASAMPIGLNWKVEDPGRSVTAGKSTKIRFSFSTKEEMDLKKVEVKPMGPLASHAATLGQPFPGFDKKGRAFVDYEARTGKDAPTGYHLISTILTMGDGSPAVIQASVRVAPLIDFSLGNDRVELKAGMQEIKIPFFIKSNTINRLDGSYDLEVPENWEILKGDDKGFIIYNSRAGARRVLTVRIPADAKGTLPIRFKGMIGQQVIEDVKWITVLRKG